MNEVWKEVHDYPAYQVSNKGRVRNKETGRILALCRNSKNGWYYVGLVRDKKQTTIPVSRLVSDAFMREPIDPNTSILHRDGDRSNNSVKNLVWAPRWFVVMYMREMNEDLYHEITPFFTSKHHRKFDSIAHFASVSLVLPSVIRQALLGMNSLHFPRYGTLSYPDRIVYKSLDNRGL